MHASIGGAPQTHAAGQPRPGTPKRLLYLYREHVVGLGREERFLIALSYLVTIGVVRFITHSIRDHRFTWLFHNVGGGSGGGTHIHHLVFGIVGLLVVGYLCAGFTPSRTWVRRTLAILFGVSAALTMDEFALWLHLQDVYWSRQGRQSVDALILLSTLVVLGATGRGLFVAMAKDVGVLWRDATGGHSR
jgi:hypothetical protein